MIKLILTDVDGTLLREGGDDLNPEYYEVIDRLKKQGILFGIASGRQYVSIKHLFDPVKKDTLFICNNGTFVTCNGQDTFVDRMNREDVLEIIEDVRRIPSCILMYDTKNLTYIESGNPGFHRMLRDDYHYAFQQVPDLTRVKEDCIKLSIYCPENIEGIMDRAFLPKWENRVKAAYSGDCYLDCMKTGSNKGHALSEIQKLYGISKEETMVFGDNLNDIEMLLQADYSFAMANAREEVRRVARNVAAPYWEDGVLAQMKKLLEE